MASTDFHIEERPRPAACPACAVAPLAEHLAELPTDAEIMLSLPTIHCAACISAVERALTKTQGVVDARVNLTLRRAAVKTDGSVGVDDLVARLAAIGYEAHELDAGLLSTTAAQRQGRDLLMRLGVAFFAMMNVMLLSVAVWSGAEGVTRDMMHWISAAIAIPAVIFSGRPFYVSAWSALRVRRLNMDVPITLAIVLAVVTSLYETAHSGAHAYFDAAISLCFFLLGGRYLDFKTRASARSAAQELSALEVPRALRLSASGEEVVAAADLRVDDVIRVRPGGRIPADGVVTHGTSELDRSLMTGESLPAAIGIGGLVSAGEINLTGPLELRVTASGRDSSLARIADLVAMAEAGRSNYTSLADHAAKLYAPFVHILSVLAAIGWWLYTQDMRVSLNIAAAVLIITCPCALGLAVPAVTTAASGRLFRKGLLIKHATALERLAEVDCVVFDKTGTLTMGAPEVISLDHLSQRQQEITAALVAGSDHPLSRALALALTQRGIRPVTVEALHEVLGAGVEAHLDGQTIRLGRAEWVGAVAVDETATYLAIGAEPAIAITFRDQIRDGATATIAALRAKSMRIVMLSGDQKGAVSRFAAMVGIEEYQAAVSPQDKAAYLQTLAAEGQTVLMVGDGLNDTVALASAHVSISPASALDAARAASDMVLLGRDLSPLPEAMEVAKSARARIKENFTLATAYNVIAVPLAVAGFATPLIAALAMSLSSITVSLNALRLRG
ncbi:heavy metal translocating P-type ATPase [Rhodobacteraceae bacterium XHP0102]|nr:heavy metal translocating P-type ATPase [Rhodobacteraceae bacterium XHP0102]